MRQKKKLLDNIKNKISELFPGLKLSNKLKARKPHIILAVTGLLLIYSFFTGATGFVRIAKLHLEKNHLEQENQKLLAKLVDVEITKKRLQNDPKYIEFIARTRHYLSRPGETIYRFKE
ncbi:MAG: septum formation initiator family protein [candidate division Zixibacteria bacterium]|nr:septum formation initiator family protein [candidate division Zixibacteria bacterium]